MQTLLGWLFGRPASTPPPTSSTSVQSNDLLSFTLSDDALDDLFGTKSQRSANGDCFLYRFTQETLEKKLQQHGIYDLIEKRGYSEIMLTVDTSDHYVHSFRITAKHAGAGPLASKDSHPRMDSAQQHHHLQRHKLVELSTRLVEDISMLKFPMNDDRVHSGARLFINYISQLPRFRLLSLEWLLLQNPVQKFDPTKPQLPSQDHPGLGAMREMAKVIYDIATECECDGIGNAPEHFHNALLYSKYGYLYADPEVQGAFDRLLIDISDDLGKRPLAEVTRAILFGGLRLCCAQDKIVRWQPQEQIHAQTDRLRAYFGGSKYAKLRNQTAFFLSMADSPSISTIAASAPSSTSGLNGSRSGSASTTAMEDVSTATSTDQGLNERVFYLDYDASSPSQDEFASALTLVEAIRYHCKKVHENGEALL